MSERSGSAALEAPATFADHARAAIEKHVPEARDPSAYWVTRANTAWVRFRRPDGFYAYFGLRRHLQWVTGAAGISRTPLELNDLDPLPGAVTVKARGYRISIGDLLNKSDRWWPAGRTREEQIECLDSLALQMSVHGRHYFHRWPGEKA